METINIDTFSEQLGIYDFFNVIVSGNIMGVLWYLIWPGFFEKRFPKGEVDTVVLVLLAIIMSYFLGMVIQELSSIVDRYILHVKDNARKTFLRDIKNDKKFFHFQWKKDYLNWNAVIENPIRLKMCRKYAEEILNDAGIKHGKILSTAQIQYVCARMEYQVAYVGKERKVEKFRALFSMARSMIICMILCAILLLITWYKGEEHFMGVLNWYWIFIIVSCSAIFFYRMKKTMRYMILIMVGNYEAYYYESKKLNKGILEK